MKMKQMSRQVTTSLLLATALTSFGCIKSPEKETIIRDKPAHASLVFRDAQNKEIKAPRRTLDAISILQKKEEAKKEEFKYPSLRTKTRKRTTPIFELK